MSDLDDGPATPPPASGPTAESIRSRPVEPRKHLILFLSWLEVEEGDGLSPEFDRSGGLDDLLDRLSATKTRWRWEMPLRAIRPHLGILETVSLVVSGRSIEDVPAFASLFAGLSDLAKVRLYVCCHPLGSPSDHRLLPWVQDGIVTRDLSRAEVLAQYGGVDFDEDFNAIFDCVSFIVHRLLTALGGFSREGDITIDITGGQKPPSIVGGAISLNRDIHVQYVQTNEPKRVKSYDIVLTHDPHLHA